MNLKTHRVVETDVILVGSGGAGGEAAIHAASQGAKVLILDRGTFGRSGATITAGHTCTAAVGDDDTPELHFRDTVIGGYGIADQRLVELYAKEAPETLYEVDQWGKGTTFRKDKDGKFDLVWPPGGHSRKRSVHYGFMTGPRILWAIRREIDRLQVPWMENILVTNILAEDGRVGGVTGLDWKTGEFIVFKSKAVILAAGGFATLWPDRLNTTAVECAGDVHGMAFEAGAEIVDMEFVQFIPAQVDPRITHINVTLTNFPAWRPKIREHGKFLNAEGEEFLASYDDLRQWNTTRDIHALAIYNEVRAGRGSPHGGCYIDLTGVPKEVIEHEFNKFQGGKSVPKSYLRRCESVGFDLSKEPMETGVKAHFTGGGVKCSADMRTTIEGLYGAGEIQGGVHGANRLGGNALTHVLTFGRVAGREAAAYAGRVTGTALSEEKIDAEHRRIFGWTEDGGTGESPVRIRQRMQETMWEKVGIVRNEKDLKAALEWFAEAKRELLPRAKVGSKARTFNPEWATAIILPRQLDTCAMVARAALERTESRGNHHREDHPALDNENWLKSNVLWRAEDGSANFRTQPVHVTTLDPKEALRERPQIAV
ncbi:MAG: FAD-binding protein [bacterium]